MGESRTRKKLVQGMLALFESTTKWLIKIDRLTPLYFVDIATVFKNSIYCKFPTLDRYIYFFLDIQ
jgi:hypothetical protein